MNEIKTHLDELQNLIFEEKEQLGDDLYKQLLEKLGNINQKVTKNICVKRFTLTVPCIYNWGVITEDEPLHLGLSERIILLERNSYNILTRIVSDESIDNKTEFEDLQIGDTLFFSGSEIPYLKDIGSDEVTIKYNHNEEDCYVGTIQCIITNIVNIGYSYNIS